MIVLSVRVNQLKNPSTTTKTSVFKVQITSSTDQLLYKWDFSRGEPTVQMAQVICEVVLVKPTGYSGIYALPDNNGFSFTCM
jgi:formylmethanofuran dehydrogenase subunit E-like metal-binding protein